MQILWGLALLAVGPLSVCDDGYHPMQQSRDRIAKDEATSDGYWKIEAVTRRGDRRLAIDKAMYHAAALAAAAGHKYVELHDGYSSQSYGEERATLFARASDAAVHPAKCRSGKRKRCYTADVAVLTKQLSGATGREPAMPIPTYDQYGRQVLQSGFGMGAIPR